jgi:hypothetical protein
MTTYRHSGTLGDLIYSLAIVKKMTPGRFMVAIDNIAACVAKYSFGNPAWAEIDPAHRGRFTIQDYEWLRPLLERQSYITDTCTWHAGDAEPTVDLDQFRGTLFRGFEGNYVEAYHRAFGMPFAQEDYVSTWLEADAAPVAPIVVSRTFRYRDPNGDQIWREIAHDTNLDLAGIFLGTKAEHEDFVRATGVDIKHHPINDFLEMANIIAGCDLFLGNQSFGYSLAVGLGKDSVLETIKIKPLQNNECYFPRPNIQYF